MEEWRSICRRQPGSRSLEEQRQRQGSCRSRDWWNDHGHRSITTTVTGTIGITSAITITVRTIGGAGARPRGSRPGSRLVGTIPCYWDYGPGEYIYCNNGIVYVNGTWFEPVPVFYQRTLLLAQQAPIWTPVQAAQIDWLPLGVFVVARDGVADNNVLVQLAVTKRRRDRRHDLQSTDRRTFPIQGMVDKQTQRAAWTYIDDMGAQIVMESSIFNLTQPAATGLIHYGPDNIQVDRTGAAGRSERRTVTDTERAEDIEFQDSPSPPERGPG